MGTHTWLYGPTITMAKININQDYAGDCHYRYHMPALETKASGMNAARNVKRTLLTNLPDVAKSLRRSEELLIQWTTSGLGSVGGCDRSSGTPVWFIKGGCERELLQKRVLEFCSHFVVCSKCGDCGTRLYCNVTGTKKRPTRHIRMKCGACGHDARTHEQDAKLGKCIEEHEHPPTQRREESGVDADKKAKHDARRQKKDKKDKRKEKKTEESKKIEESDEEEWSVDTSAEAVQARREAELQRMGASARMVAKPSKELPQPPHSLFTSEDPSIGHDHLLNPLLAHVGDSKRSKEVLAAAEAWIEDLNVPEEKRALFGVLENLPERIMKHSNAVLKVMYDQDAVSEKDILKWHAAADHENKAVANAKAFIDFLKD